MRFNNNNNNNRIAGAALHCGTELPPLGLFHHISGGTSIMSTPALLPIPASRPMLSGHSPPGKQPGKILITLDIHLPLRHPYLKYH